MWWMCAQCYCLLDTIDILYGACCYVCCSDCVRVCGNVCYVATAVEDRWDLALYIVLRYVECL